MSLRLTSFVALVLAATVVAPDVARAQDAFPAKSIRFVVPYPPGGGNDVVARALGAKIAESIGQPVVIDNKPGASGMIAGEFVAKAPPDGYTIMIDHAAIVMNPALYPAIKYDVRKDLAPVMLAAVPEHVLLVNPSLPVKTARELIDYAKANPGKLNYSSTGSGGPQHVLMEVFKRNAGIDMVHVPYKGGAPATLATASGEVQTQLISISTALPHIQSGRLRPLATFGTARSPVLPDVPTLTELGLPPLSSPWLGIFVPARTPAPIVQRLNAEFVKALAAADVRETMAKQAITTVASTPEAFGKILDDELQLYSRVIRDANIKGD
jgi:tripartite-type tricarboxylate transporter receptor subunit TctC